MTTFVDQTTLISAAFLNAVAAVTEASATIAVSGVTPAADKFPYFTSASAAALADISAFARTLLDDADAAAMRNTLGVSGGATGDAITAIAALTPAADTFPYYTGTADAALATITTFGRTLAACANAAAALAAIGAAPTANATFTGTTTLGPTALGNSNITGVKTLCFNGIIDDGNSGAADTIDFGAGQYHKSTLTGNCTYTFTAPAGPCVVHLELIQDGTGSRVMTLPASVKWDAGYAAGDKLLSTTASARDLLILKYNGTDYVADLKKGIA